MTDAPQPALNVLVVDPAPGEGARACAVLRELGHRAKAVLDWPQATVEFVLWRYDAVLMPAATPGAAGRGAIGLLRGERPQIADLPVVGVVPVGEHRGTARALGAGFDAVVMRPVDGTALAAALAEALRRRAPPELLDAARRDALRAELGTDGLAARDTAAIARVSELVAPLLEQGGGRAAIREAADEILAAMEGIGAVHAAEAARGMAAGARSGLQAIQPVMAAVIATRTALRRERVTPPATAPISPANDIPAGDPT